jgi:hypothetical protein
MTDETQIIGRVVAVSGTRMVARMTGDGGAPDVRVGMLVHAATGDATAYGIVSALRVVDSADGNDKRLFEVDLLGETVTRRSGGGRAFQRGVSFYPALNTAIRPATPDDYAAVYQRPTTANVPVGTVYHSDGLPAFVTIDDLLGKHFAVLGTTGTGKSCAVALILRTILSRHPNGHVVLLDPHNEYAAAFGDMAEMVNTGNLDLPYWLLTGEEIASILIGRERTENDARWPILFSAILAAKQEFLGAGTDGTHLTVDTPSPYRLTTLLRILDDHMGRLEKPEGSLPYLRLKARIEALRSDTRYSFMFSGLVVRDVMTDVVSRLLRVPVAGRPITIIDLSAVPSEIIDTVVSVLCRLIFDFCLWSEPVQALPVLLVCEEAHRYVPRGEGTGFEPSKRILSRIAKEGRKYGVALGLVTQRPSELSTTILSQCSTLFALRMSNERDQEFVLNALPENAAGFLNALSSLRTQEAIAVGEGVTVPMRLMFADLPEEHQPRSGNAAFSRAWLEDDFRKARVAQIVQRWRSQSRTLGLPDRETPAA